jgi:tRNA-modifying protein YgfZ
MVVMISATQMNQSQYSSGILPDRSLIRLTGDGCLAFLHNLLTADLTQAKPAYAALLSPQGKILHDVFVVPDGDLIFIDVAKTQAADLHKRLMIYRLRAKFEILIDASKSVAVSPQADVPDICFADPRLAAMGFRGIVDAGNRPVATGYHQARLTLGLADSVEDIGSGELFVQEANLDQLHGVSFSKGCYVGQEVVSRSHHRHTTRNRILPVSFQGSANHGQDIQSGDTRIGTMLSSEDGKGLALMRLDRLAEATEPVLAGDVRLRIHRPDWAKFDFTVPEVAQ